MKKILSGVLSVALSFGVFGGVPCVEARSNSLSQTNNCVSKSVKEVDESRQYEESTAVPTEKDIRSVIETNATTQNLPVSEKSYLATLLLNLLLGSVFSRFYTGHWKTAIGHFLIGYFTGGVGSLICSLVDVIELAAGRYKDADGLLVVK